MFCNIAVSKVEGSSKTTFDLSSGLFSCWTVCIIAYLKISLAQGKKIILNLSEQFSVFYIWLSKFQEASRSGTELWIVLSQYFPHVSYFLVSFIISII